jgi:hypothetical protein
VDVAKRPIPVHKVIGQILPQTRQSAVHAPHDLLGFRPSPCDFYDSYSCVMGLS